MLDPKRVRSEPDVIASKLRRKKFELDTEKLASLDSQRKELQSQTEALQNERNSKSKLIGKAKAAGEDVNEILAGMESIKSELDEKKAALEILQGALSTYLLGVPNLPDDDVPEGDDETSNLVLEKWGSPLNYSFEVKDHSFLGEALAEGLNFASAAKITGARFVVLEGQLAKLHRALIQFMLDIHTDEHGYCELNVPYIVNETSLIGTSQLPKFEEDLFKTTTDHWLIPTAEVPLTNIVADEITDSAVLPLRMTAYTQCFRSEAGSAGRDTRGMIRQHQFSKVEMVSITHPDQSADELERMTSCAETILQKLELPYRVLKLCSGDTGFSAQQTYDLEVWLPGQDEGRGMYREISSCSNCGPFQARRMKARFRDVETGETRFLHTLNGSGLAVGRTLIAILENGQQEDGSIRLPQVLHSYMGTDRLVAKA